MTYAELPIGIKRDIHILRMSAVISENEGRFFLIAGLALMAFSEYQPSLMALGIGIGLLCAASISQIQQHRMDRIRAWFNQDHHQ